MSLRRTVQHPARLLPIGFLVAIAGGTSLLLLPAARADPDGSTSLVTALFTATSAVCVTGLTVVDTSSHWSDFGQWVIIGSVKVGGYGIMTAATLLGLVVARRLGLRLRMVALTEGRSLDLANVRGVLIQVALIQTGFEAAIAVPLTFRWWLGYDRPFQEALWQGIFHSIGAFNNAGFSLFSDSMTDYVGDWWISVPLALGVIAGSLGFPVIIELARRLDSPRRWSVHTKLTVLGSAALLVAGFLALIAFEWGNPATIGSLSAGDKILAAFFNGGAMPRSGGFNSVDFAAMQTETIAVMNALMFIGGGSGSTAGGIKIATFLLLASVIWSEIRGEPDVTVGGRRIAGPAQRQALSVALLGVALVAVGMLLVESLSEGFRFEHIMFDVISAFATVGLSTGVTSGAPAPAQLVLAALMFVGRVGPVVVATGLALNTRRRHYRYPEERPLVG